MKGGTGWAITALPYSIVNVYSWQGQIAGARATNGSVASFSHPSVAGAFSSCYWGSGSNAALKVGMTCKYTR